MYDMLEIAHKIAFITQGLSFAAVLIYMPYEYYWLKRNGLDF